MITRNYRRLIIVKYLRLQNVRQVLGKVYYRATNGKGKGETGKGGRVHQEETDGRGRYQ
jgi:hypothetical protein